VAESARLQCPGEILRPRQPESRQAVAFEEFFDDEVLLRSGEKPGRPGEGQDTLGFGPADHVKGVGRPGPGGRSAEASVQPGREPVPQGIGSEPAGGQDQHPFGVHAVTSTRRDGSFDEDSGFARSGRARHQDRPGPLRDVNGCLLIGRQ
jgi:hypothetical protein